MPINEHGLVFLVLDIVCVSSGHYVQPKLLNHQI